MTIHARHPFSNRRRRRPVAHSLSPLIHNRWIAEARLDAVYVALHLKSADAAADLRALARTGFSGLNVTLPHKAAALASAAHTSPVSDAYRCGEYLARESDGWLDSPQHGRGRVFHRTRRCRRKTGFPASGLC